MISEITVGSGTDTQHQNSRQTTVQVDLLAQAPVLNAVNAADPVLEAPSTTDQAAPATDNTSANGTGLDSDMQPDLMAAAGVRELVFVSENIADYQQLIADLQRAGGNRIIEVVVLEADRDGIEQVSEILADRSDLAAVHFITHGADGQINLGNTWLNSATLQQKSTAVTGWGDALSETGDILFYGCNIAGDSTGQSLLNDIARLTGADVAASSDLTGNAKLGGDWVLEYTKGAVETDIAFAKTVQQDWTGVLGQITVTTTNDNLDSDADISSLAALAANPGADGEVSLREAIIAANTDAGVVDEIILNTGIYTLSLTGANEDAAASGDLDVTDDLIISGAGARTTLIDGAVSDRVFEVLGSTVTISGITIQNGSANDGGGIRLDGSSSLTLRDSAVSGNQSTSTGGGIFASGELTLERVTLEGNSSDVGGGIYLNNGVIASLSNATLSGNTAASNGGAIFTRTTVDITNSTIADNNATAGAGGIHKAGSGNARLKNTILAYNTGGNSNGALISLGNNIDSLNTAGLIGPGDQIMTDPSIGGLQYNSGPTKTHALLAGSPAINAGTATGAPTVDQRGISRDATPDIGSFEYLNNILIVDTTSDMADGNTSSITALLGNKGTDGRISLREAILATNNTSNLGVPDIILFNIAGTGTHTIAPTSALPAITDAVTIDATNDDSFAANGNKPAIVLEGSDFGFGWNGLVLTSTADGSTIRGLIIRNWEANGILIMAGSDNNVIVGNYIGRLNPNGTASGAGTANNGDGVHVEGANNIIGGTVPGDGNVISGNSDTGIEIQGSNSTGNRIEGNIIGLNAAGTAAIGNLDGVIIEDAPNNTIGGATSAQRNVISGNAGGLQGNGVVIFGADAIGNLVQNNYIGTDITGSLDLGNAGSGVLISDNGDGGVFKGGASGNTIRDNVLSGNIYSGVSIANPGANNNSIFGNLIGVDASGIGALGNSVFGVVIWNGASGNRIGGTAVGEGNVIAFNNRGVLVDANFTASMNNAIRGNSIHSNALLGIDLRNDGVTVNDPGDGDLGPNGLRNYPVVTSAVVSGTDLTITGTLNTLSSLTNQIDFYWSPTGDPSGHGEGQTFIGTTTVTSNFFGNASFNVTFFGVSVPVGAVITATATDSSGNTSEFAQNVTTIIGNDPGSVSIDNLSPAQGDTLTATVSDADGVSGAISYQWYRGAAPIAGATAGSYTTVQADVGYALTVKATYTDDLGAAENPISAPTAAVTNVNDAPSVNLDGDDSSGAGGNDYAFTFTEGDGATAIADSDTDVADVDSTTFDQVTLAVSGLLDGNAEELVLDGDNFALATATAGQDTSGGSYHVVITTGAGTANVTITKQGGGTFTEAETETLIEAIQYRHVDGDNPTDGNRQIDVTVNDGTADSAATRTTINVNPVNDAPTITTVTGASMVDEDAVYSLDLTFSDPDDSTVTWTVNWGDGQISSAPSTGATTTLTHTYTQPGFTYNILVSANDGDVTVLQNELLVPTYAGGPDSIFRYEETTGAFLQEFATANGLDDAIQVVIGPDGNLYVTGEASNHVLRYNAVTGAFIDEFVSAGSGGLNEPGGLAFGPDGNLYVSSFGTDEVLRYDGTSGAFIDAFVTAGSGGLNEPYSLTFGSDGNLYVNSYSDSQVLRYNGTTGAFIDVFVSSGSGGLRSPEQMIFGPDGNLYIASYDTNEVLRYNGATGVFIDAFVTAGLGGLDQATGLAFGPDGNLYVADFKDAVILRYNGTTGVFIDEYVSAGSGGLVKPVFISFLPEQQVTVIDVNDPGTVTIDNTTPAQGDTLTATVSDADGVSGAISYQWYRGAAPIAGATAGSYTTVQADVGYALTVTATYTDDLGAAETTTSAATANVTNVNDLPAGVPVITGTVTEDQTLTADTSGISDADGLGAFSYQWLRNGAVIVGATSSTYTLADADVGNQISVQVSYTDGQGTPETVISVQTAAVANLNDVPVGVPTITGTVTEDQTLTADTSGISDADGLGAFSYQWLRNGAVIVGATSSTYTLADADVGNQISVQVSYTDGQGTPETLTSAQTAAVVNLNDAPVGLPVITGTVTEDQTLTADTTGISDADGLGGFSYQWLRNGAVIVGATSSTYALGDADVGTQISVQVSYTDGQSTPETLTSAQTASVANINDAPVGVPVITGTADRRPDPYSGHHRYQ